MEMEFKQVQIFSKHLCLGVFVAGKDFSEWTQFLEIVDEIAVSAEFSTSFQQVTNSAAFFFVYFGLLVFPRLNLNKRRSIFEQISVEFYRKAHD